MEGSRFAILIDSDNISAKYISAILDEMTKHGVATYRRIYGDWTSTQARSWKNQLAENSITPIQQFSNTVGKNATDSALIIDAMDILYTGYVDGFCIVSSDGDFTRLASRLRESGMTVIGMGEEKTPRSFKAACTQFTVLENLIDVEEEEEAPVIAAVTKSKSKKAVVKAEKVGKESNVISKEIIEKTIIGIITENENKDKETGLAEVGNRLVNKFPDFDVRNYGYSLLSKFLEEAPSLELIKTETKGINVKLKHDVESKEEICGYMKRVVKDSGKKGIGANELSNKIHEKYTRFNIKDYGYYKFTKFVQSIPGMELYEDDLNRKWVRMN